MCDPITIGAATAALSIATTTVGYIGQGQAYKANETAANINYARDQDAAGRQQVQLDKKASENSFDTAIAQLQAEGDIAASATDRGLGTSSIVQSLNASMFGIGRQATAESINDRSARQNIAESRTDAQVRRQSQINSLSKPSSLSLVLGIGQGALAGANAYNGAKKAG